MKTIDHMVETAISGEFSERFFDESVMSAVEAKLAQFLFHLLRFSKNLLAETNKINELISTSHIKRKHLLLTSSFTHNCLANMICWTIAPLA
ncbi:hypothetical protein [Paenibacillus polymyxa]|uniref:hypothetical protein n=1 Tax=Paenibacillus polymyxa TaxID=1406 RepID=UPI00287F62F2|nr:hypothetical protein [Paenibacillus polymyxa]